MGDSTDKVVELKVSGNTQPSKLGGAIAKYLKEVPLVCVPAMGDAAVNAAVKGIIVAQSFVSYEAHGLDLRLGFQTKYDEVLQKDVTRVAFYVKLKEVV